MMRNLKKWWPLKAALCLATTNMLCAADEARMRNLENRVTALENSKNGNCLVNPAARPFAPDCWGFYLKVDPLIWQAHVNGLPVVLIDYTSTAPAGEAYSKYKTVSFNWDWGVRVGLGFNTTHDAWDILAQWTYWKSTGVQQIAKTLGTFLDPSQGDVVLINDRTPTNADANWHLNFNLLDLQNGRDFFVSKYLTMRPFMGLRSAWIKQTFDSDYTGFNDAFSEVKVVQGNRFWGIGILGGLDLQWGFPGGWSLFSNYSGSLMYGFYSISQSNDSYHYSTLTNGAQGIPTIQSSPVLKSFYHVGTAIMDMQIGLRYDWISCDECYHVGLDLGWENHYFPGQNQFLTTVNDAMKGKVISNQGDLAMQGYFLKVRFDF